MAFTALYDDEERGAWSVPKGEDAYCTDCGDAMHVVSESSDGRARHFRHNPDHSGGGGGGGGCSGGESDEHKKWKNFAAERLHELFGDRATDRATVEEPLAAPISDKQERAADACVFFENNDRQFGRGLAIEVQHKNKDKDKLAVERDYDRQGVATLWLTGDDFHDDGLRLTELDIRHRVREQTSICELTDKWVRVPARGNSTFSHVKLLPKTHENLVYEVHDPRDRQASVPAKIPTEFFDQTALELWREHDWKALFPDWQTYSTETVEIPPYPRAPVKTEINIIPFLSEQFWRDAWLNGKDTVSTEPALTCSECSEIIDSKGHAESVAKLFKFHVKREHKSKLKRQAGSQNSAYINFLDRNHRARLEGTGSPVIRELKA